MKEKGKRVEVKHGFTFAPGEFIGVSDPDTNERGVVRPTSGFKKDRLKPKRFRGEEPHMDKVSEGEMFVRVIPCIVCRGEENLVGKGATTVQNFCKLARGRFQHKNKRDLYYEDMPHVVLDVKAPLMTQVQLALTHPTVWTFLCMHKDSTYHRKSTASNIADYDDFWELCMAEFNWQFSDSSIVPKPMVCALYVEYADSTKRIKKKRRTGIFGTFNACALLALGRYRYNDLYIDCSEVEAGRPKCFTPKVSTSPPTTKTAAQGTSERIVKKLEKREKAVKTKEQKLKNHTQRLIELEKSRRSKNRERMAFNKVKAFAQGTVSDLVSLPSVWKTVGEKTISFVEHLDALTQTLRNIFNPDLFDVLVWLCEICENLLHGNSITMTSVIAYSYKLAKLCSIKAEDVRRGLEIMFGLTYKEKVAEETVSTAQGISSLVAGLPVAIMAQIYCVVDMIFSGKGITHDTVQNHMAHLGRVFQGVRHTSDFITSSLDYLKDMYYQYLYGKTQSQIALMRKYPRLENLFALVQLFKQEPLNVIAADKTLCLAILRIQRELQDYRMQAIRADDRVARQMIDQTLKEFEEFVKEARASPANNLQTRKCPTTFYVYGQPGVGKTTFNRELVCSQFRRFKDKNPALLPSHLSYTRRTENEFWDGYCYQPIVIYDDFFQQVDSIANPNLAVAEVINIVNCEPLQLHMSDIKDKKSTYFTSEVVIFSSNTKVPMPKSITCATALHRRFDMCIEVKVRPECGSLIGDRYVLNDTKSRKYASDNGIEVDGAFQTHHYLFDIYTMSKDGNSEVVETNVTFNQLMAKVNDKIDDKDEVEQELLDSIHKRHGIDIKSQTSEISDQVTTLLEPVDIDSVLQSLAESRGVEEVFSDALDIPMDYLSGCLASLKQGCNVNLRPTFDQLKDKVRRSFEIILNQVWKVTGKVSEAAKQLWAFLKRVFSWDSLPYVGDNEPDFLDDMFRKEGSGLNWLAIGGFGALGTLAIMYLSKRLTRSTVCEFVGFGGNNPSPCFTCEACNELALDATCNWHEQFLALVKANKSKHVTAASVAAYTLSQEVYAQSREISTRKVDVSKSFAQSREINTRKTTVGRAFAQNDLVKIAQEPVAQAARDLVTYEVVTKTVAQNGALFTLKDYAVNEQHRCNVIFVCGRVGLLPYHIVSRAHPGATCFLQWPHSNGESIEIPWDNVRVHQLTRIDSSPIDLAFLEFPRCIPFRKNIVSKFLDANQYQHIALGASRLVRSGYKFIDERSERFVCYEDSTPEFDFHDSEYNYYQNVDGQQRKITVHNYVSYEMWNSSGLCGSLLSLEGKQFVNKLIGVHVAGLPTLGVSIAYPTSKELLERNLELSGFSVGVDARVPYAQDLCLKGDYIPLGKVGVKMHSPTKTELRPSDIHNDVFVTLTKPAYLRPIMVDGLEVNPKLKGIEKVTKSQKYISDRDLEIVKADIVNLLDHRTTPYVLSIEAAVEGMEGHDFVAPINRKSSPGFPFNLANPGKGKQFWCGNDENYYVHPELREEVEKLLDDCRHNRRGDVMFTATLKDERRPIDKVNQGKTRVFEAAPMHFVVAFRMYFLAFAEMVMAGKIDNEIAVGTNTFSLDWHRIGCQLQSKGDKVIAGDFSAFDGSLSYQLLQTVLDIVNDWYSGTEEETRIRTVLWEEICASNVLVDDYVIRQTHSQPSGNPFTVIANSFVNSLVMRLAYLRAKRENVPDDPSFDFRTHVALISYGDDNVLNISDEVIDWFNQVSITHQLKAIGFTYTDEAKTGELKPFRKLEDVGFLKRSFKVDKTGCFIGPLDLSVVLDMTNWVRGNLTKESTKENVEFALRELSLHGKDVYNHYSRSLRSACAQKRIPLDVKSYEEWEDITCPWQQGRM